MSVADPSDVLVEQMALSDEYLDAVGRMRVDAWAAQYPDVRSMFPTGKWLDDHDQHAVHVVVRSDSSLVAAARLCVHDTIDQIHSGLFVPGWRGPFAYVARMVTRPDARNRGFATRLDAWRITKAKELRAQGVVACWSSYSGDRRLSNLKAQGFERFSSVHDHSPFPDEAFTWLLKPL